MGTTSRNIVLLSDGTGNSRGKHFRTNVWRVYEALDLADPKNPREPRQFAFYDDGVGSSSFKPAALLGGALGIGLARNVCDLYQFLCRTYRDGDRIYAFGFSRGAFTIRVLVGLIMSQGIVRYNGDEGELSRLSKAAYRAYRYKYKPAFNYILPLRKLRDALIAGWARSRGREPYRKEDNLPAPEIEFLGVWDTVDAYGLPVDELMRAIDKVVWPVTMRDLNLDRRVKRAVHALALDDERNTFHPRLWNEADEENADRIRQVWFAGMHSDVGGGYADQGLSHVSLDWVMTAAVNAVADPDLRLRFVERVREEQRELSDENGPMNDSRRGLAGYYRYNPRRLERLYADAGMAGIRPKVHMSAMRRITVGQDAYAPITLPRDFDVVRMRNAGPGAVDPDGPDIVSAATYLGIGDAALEKYQSGRERVFNRVWFKRVIYFATFGLTCVLLGLPLFSDSGRQGCESSLCWVSPMIRGLDLVLPDFVSGWTAWYAKHPTSFVMLSGLIALGLWLGGLLQRGIGDAMRRVWYAIGETRPSSAEEPPTKSSKGLAEPVVEFVQWLRTRQSYQAAFRLLTMFVLPGAFLIVLVGAVATSGSALLFAAQASSGSICTISSSRALVDSRPQTRLLEIRQLCSATGLGLEAGGTYQLSVSVVTASPEDAWREGGEDIPADLRGVQSKHVTWGMRLGTLLRREMSEPWLLPVARIGHRGADTYPLRPDPSLPVDHALTVMHTRLVARSSGELFLYVNDAVGPPWDWNRFYANNRGIMRVDIARVEPSEPPVPAGDVEISAFDPQAGR